MMANGSPENERLKQSYSYAGSLLELAGGSQYRNTLVFGERLEPASFQIRTSNDLL